MKLSAALEIIRSEIDLIQGASPRFFIAIGFLLGLLERAKITNEQTLDLEIQEFDFKDTK